jgi:hypothetical protein
MKTTDVHVPDARTIQQATAPFRIPWKAAVQAHSAAKPTLLHEVRWRTDGTLHKARRRARALTEAFRLGIPEAAENGEEFDAEPGLPESMRSVCP